MLRKKGFVLVLALLAAAILLTGQARLRLDDMVEGIRDDFEEMMYLPRGNALKAMAGGFAAPLADALFIKGMLYYAESFQSKHRDARRSYTYDLFDVVTDLSPRFSRAYQMGSLFLSSSASHQSALDGVRLLEKGIRRFSEMAVEGRPADPDMRWLFHTLIANIFETNIQSYHRKNGDAAGAAEARRRAAEEFRLAAASPDAPDYVAFAAAGIEAVLAGQGGIEHSLMAVLSVWKFLYNEAVARGDKDILPDLEERIGTIEEQVAHIQITRELEKRLADAGREFIERTGSAPASPMDLVKEKLIPGLPILPLGTEETPDEWLTLPDGTFRSRLLAELDTANDLDRLSTAVIDFRKAHPTPPKDPRDLIVEGFIDAIPEPPLKQLGQAYRYDAGIGVFDNIMPEELEPQANGQ